MQICAKIHACDISQKWECFECKGVGDVGGKIAQLQHHLHDVRERKFQSNYTISSEMTLIVKNTNKWHLSFQVIYGHLATKEY